MKKSLESGSRCLLVFALCALTLRSAVVDAAVYVAQASATSPPAILVFASDAIGDAAPIRVITGGNTGLISPDGLAVDDLNNELYVSDCYAASIFVFALDADGDIAPLRTITYADGAFHCVRKVEVDTVNDEIFVPSFEITSSTISVFQRSANGASTPIRTLSGATTRIDNPIGFAFDSVNQEIVVDSYSGGGPGVPGLLVFPSTASGDVAPSRVVAGANTLLEGYSNALAFDPDNGEIYADANGGGGRSYVVFPRLANGDVAPTRSVSGPDTGFRLLMGFAYDRVNERVAIVDGDSHFHDPYEVQTLRVFHRIDDGDVPPVVTIGGPHTLIDDPSAIAIDAGGGFSGVGPQVFASEAGFDAAVGDVGALAIEDFEGGSAAPGQTRVCSEPLDANSDDACFTPGQLIQGFVVQSSSGNGLSLIGSGSFGNASAVVGAIFTGDATVVRFDSGVTAFALDVYLQAGSNNGGVTLAAYDGESDRPLSYTRVQPADGAPAFFGVVSATPLKRVELHSANGAGVALIDNLRFKRTDDIFAGGFDP